MKKHVLFLTIAGISFAYTNYINASTLTITGDTTINNGSYGGGGEDYGIVVEGPTAGPAWQVNVQGGTNVNTVSKGGLLVHNGANVDFNGTSGASLNFNGTSGGEVLYGVFGVAVNSDSQATFNNINLSIQNTVSSAHPTSGMYNSGTLNFIGNGTNTIFIQGSTSSADDTANLYNSGTFTVSGTDINMNSVQSSAGDAFGIENLGTFNLLGQTNGSNTLTVNQSNSSLKSGGIYNQSTGNFQMTNMNLNVTGNVTSGSTAGIYNEGFFNIEGSAAKPSTLNVSGNQSQAGTFGIYNTDELNVTNMNISVANNSSTGADAYSYGIYNLGGEINMTAGQQGSFSIGISNNSANTSTGRSYGISSNGGVINITNLKITASSNSGNEGYGIEARNGGEINLTSTGSRKDVILNNNSSYAVYSHDNSTINFTAMNITAQDNKFALVSDDGTLNLSNTTVLLSTNHDIFNTNSGTANISITNGSSILGNGGTFWRVTDTSTGVMTSDRSLFQGQIITDSTSTSSLALNTSSSWRIGLSSNLTSITNNNSSIDMRHATTGTYNTLTLENYSGSDGKLLMSTFMGGDTSPTDQLIIDGGSATGTTTISITTTGIGPADINNGIKIVDASAGTTAAGAFILDGGVIDTGAYEYYLLRGDKDGNDMESWYLRFDTNNNGGGGGGGEDGDGDGDEDLTNIAKTVSNLPAALIHLVHTGVTSLIERLGEIRNEYDCPSNGIWSKAYGKGINIHERIEMDMNMYGVEAGYDHKWYLGHLKLYAGIMGGITFTDNIKVKQTNGGDNGTGKGMAPSVGLYATLLHDSGIYLDLVMRNFWHKSDMTNYSANNQEIKYSTTRYMGALSAEIGKQYIYASGLFLEPNIQGTYGYAPAKKFNTNLGSNLKWDKTESLLGRAGFRFGFRSRTNAGTIWEPYGHISISSEWKGKTAVEFDNVKYESDAGEITGLYTIGVNMKTKDCFSMYADFTYENGKVTDAIGGSIGLRYKF